MKKFDTNWNYDWDGNSWQWFYLVLNNKKKAPKFERDFQNDECLGKSKLTIVDGISQIVEVEQPSC